MTVITTWQWVGALLVGVIFFVVFSAGYGLFVYTHPTKIISSQTPADFGLEFEDITITTSDNLKLAAWFIPASAKAQAGRPAQKETKKAVLLLHGYPADKGDILSSMVFLREDYNLLLLDFRYFGDSEGSYSTVGVKEAEDVLAGVRLLKERGMERIGVWGFSAGAASALMALPKTNDIDAVVSESSYASLSLMAKEVYVVPGLNNVTAWLTTSLAKVFLDIDIENQSPLFSLPGIETPILFIHSQDDKVIPFSQAELLRAAGSHNPSAEFWFRESLGHGYIGSQEYSEKVRDFFARHL